MKIKHKHYRILAGVLLTVSMAANAEVTVKDAWVRGTVPAQTVTGAFMTITSSEDAKIVKVSSPIAKRAELHQSQMTGGVNHMQDVEAIALPAGKPVKLEAGGYHLMLMDVAKALKPGDTVPITFTVEGKGGKRSEVKVDAPVKPINTR
ncbi:MAG TPA: copper chaperone PCu(A)C [Usitatibacter sp.]|jgi:copper(I)-binding protein|nr:copper chaperone PCu(A)C [Usitatibacter sp.]